MAKFKILETEETHTVTLRQNTDGTVTLRVDEYNILTITNEGSVMFIPHVSKDIGLVVDAFGFVVTAFEDIN